MKLFTLWLLSLSLLPSIAFSQIKLLEREAKIWTPQAREWKENNAQLGELSRDLHDDYQIQISNVRVYESHPEYYFVSVRVNKIYSFDETNDKGEVVKDEKGNPKKVHYPVTKFDEKDMMFSPDFPVFFGCGIKFTAQVFKDKEEIVIGTEHVEDVDIEKSSYMKDGKFIDLESKLTSYGLRKAAYMNDNEEWNHQHIAYLFYSTSIKEGVRHLSSIDFIRDIGNDAITENYKFDFEVKEYIHPLFRSYWVEGCALDYRGNACTFKQKFGSYTDQFFLENGGKERLCYFGLNHDGGTLLQLKLDASKSKTRPEKYPSAKKSSPADSDKTFPRIDPLVLDLTFEVTSTHHDKKTYVYPFDNYPFSSQISPIK